MLRLPLSAAGPAAAAAALAPSGALAAAALATAGFEIDRGAAATTAFFGWLALGVLGALALGLRAPRALPALLALAVGVALVGLPHLGMLRPAVTMALLAAAVVAQGAAALGRGPLGARGWFALALAAQLVARADRLFLAPTAAATVGLLLALPLAAALALDRLERTGAEGGRLAAGAALAAFLAGPGWTLGGALALGLAALVARALAARPAATSATAVALVAGVPLALGPEPAWLALAVLGTTALAVAAAAPAARLATLALVTLALGATLGGTLPWRRAAPAASLIAAAVAPAGRSVERAVEMQPVVLSAASPRLTVELDGREIGAVVIDSYLTRSVDLACGTPVARVRVELEGAPVSASRRTSRRFSRSGVTARSGPPSAPTSRRRSPARPPPPGAPGCPPPAASSATTSARGSGSSGRSRRAGW